MRMLNYLGPNELLKQIPFPFEATLNFDSVSGAGKSESVDAFLFWEAKNIKIILRQPFVYGILGKSAYISSEKDFRSIEAKSKFVVEAIEINDLGMLIIKCSRGVFQCIPGIYFGWGIYSSDEEIIQHYGWEEGIEYCKEFKF